MDREQTKLEIKGHLLDYINNSGRSINKNGNFKCFNSAAHSHGDKTPSAAIVPGTNDEGWKCFGCGAAGDIFTAVKLEEGKEFVEALEYLADKYSVLIDKPIQRTKAQETTQVVIKKYNFTDLINTLHRNSSQTDYYLNRGFSQELISTYKLGFTPKGYNDALKGFHELNNGMNNIEAYKYIIPILNIDGSCNYFIARRDDSLSKDNCKTLNMKKEAGGVRIFNDRYLMNSSLTGKFIFLVEGWADALSYEEVGQKAIALNSTSNVNIFLNLAKENIDKIKNKIFIVVGDNDKAGQIMNKALSDGLKALNLSVEAFEIANRYKDSNEYLKNERESFKADIDRFISSIYDKDFTITYVEDYINQIEKQKNNKAILTGFNEFDRKLGGGLFSGLYVIGAISSLGKTTFILQLTDDIAARGHDVLFFSLEMSKFEIVSKSLSREMFILDDSAGKVKSVGNRDIMQGKADFNLMAKAFNKYLNTGKHMGIIEGFFDTDIQKIKNRIKQHISLRETKPVIVIDYLQILKPVDVRMSDKQATDYNVTELKRISRDYDVPVIVVSSLNRQNYLTPISFESFKESGSVEYTADVLLGLQLSGMDEVAALKKVSEQRDKVNQLKSAVPREIELVCLKQRNGIPCFTQWYDYHPKFNYFEERK